MGTDTTMLWLASLELPRLEACVELMFWTAYADGHVSPEERAVFAEHVRRATGGQLGPELVLAVIRGVEEAVKTADRSARVASIASVLDEPRIRSAALSLAVTVALADRTLTRDELVFLNQAGAAFGMSPEDVQRLIANAAG